MNRALSMLFGVYLTMENNSPARIDLYGIYINTITAAENRRQQVSAIYFSLISAGIGLTGTYSMNNTRYLLPLIAFISVIWLITIRYFRKLAQAKFKVIEKLEKDWELQPFATEWEYLKAQKKKSFLCISLTSLEMMPPVIALLYSAVSFFVLVLQ